MAQNRIAIETSFEIDKVIEPIYSGGAVALTRNGRLLATTLNEDALLTDLSSGQRLAKVEGVRAYTPIPGCLLLTGIGWRGHHHSYSYFT